MTVTVWGECGGPNTAAASRDRYGQFNAHSYRELSLELPVEGIEIDCDHDQRSVGRLVYAELGDDERLRAVCAIDGDWLEEVDEPVYFSPMFEMRGRGIDRSDTYIAREAELIGLSLTLQTARVGARPVSRRQGDLRDSSDRFSKWPSSWESSDPLLARALGHLGSDWRVRTRSASRIVDRRDNGDYPWHLVRTRNTWTPSGESGWTSDGRPVGPTRHGPRGRIISVR